MLRSFLIILLFCCALSGSAAIHVTKNINYAGGTDNRKTLNIYHRTGTSEPQPVLIFIHGGSWSSGKKETYWWLGRNFASSGITTVVINYPLAPDAGYVSMANACAEAVKWVQLNIATYNGDPSKIFIMGHSAGGHLAALINSDPRYFEKAGIKNPIRGVILNDPFGLDMGQYLTVANKDSYYNDFIRTFTDKPENWRAGSPFSYISKVENPHLLFFGGRTYEAIQLQTPAYAKALKDRGIAADLTQVPRKKHVAMITQMIFRKNWLYDSITEFVNKISGADK